MKEKKYQYFIPIGFMKEANLNKSQNTYFLSNYYLTIFSHNLAFVLDFGLRPGRPAPGANAFGRGSIFRNRREDVKMQSLAFGLRSDP